MAFTLKWGSCQGDVWCSFQRLSLSSPVFDNAIGVYIIWDGKTTIKVGGGNIREEITKDRQNDRIAAFQTAKVTWANTDFSNIEPIKKYLQERLNPQVLEVIEGNASPIEVNYPW
jgi:hypothetical protein